MTARMICITTIAGCCVLLSWSSASAGDVTYSKEYSRCIDAAGGVTPSLNDCTKAETDRWDKQLNVTYKSLLATLSPERRKALVAAEAAWVKFRDTNCAFIFDPDGGQAAGMASYECVLRMTAERALELENFKSR